jgi:hypothetical protein
MGTHKNSRELHISLPWVYHLLWGEALEIKQKQVDKSLNKCEIPTIAGNKKYINHSYKSIMNKIILDWYSIINITLSK